MVTDFSAEDKASSVNFCICTTVHWHPRHAISHFGELCYPRSPKWAGESATHKL